ncbi:hypothetical protein CPY51_19920 [Rhizobium tubonense]|uniref:Uncharacterized protein n=1 Tax=Rhizobium tubonense TaxID=484088 RepID=A0A2W4EIZ2_9HYPH|nr:hypothetical protein CPY51_19920 [Rhizobium tubonense]
MERTVQIVSQCLEICSEGRAEFERQISHREPPQPGSRACRCLLQAFLSGCLRFRRRPNAAGLGLDTIGFGRLLEPPIGCPLRNTSTALATAPISLERPA